MEIKQEMINWIKEQNAQGHSKEDVFDYLIKQGYGTTEIEEAMELALNPGPQISPMYAGMKKPNNILMIVGGITGTLLVVAIVVTALIYFYNEKDISMESVEQDKYIEPEVKEIAIDELATTTGEEIVSQDELQEIIIDTSDTSAVSPKMTVTEALPDTIQTPPKEEQDEIHKVVVGYEWISNPGSPKFASTTIPMFWFSEDSNWEEKEYGVYIWQEDDYVFYKSIKSTGSVSFPSGGISKFKVIGIDPKHRVCPGARGYMFAMYFTESGMFDGVRVPITELSPSNLPCKKRY